LTEEPSVLDYVKARLTPWRGPAPQIPEQPSEPARIQQGSAAPVQAVQSFPARQVRAAVFPGAAAAALGLALSAQFVLEPNAAGAARAWQVGAFLYLASFITLVASVFLNQIETAPPPERVFRLDALNMNLKLLWVGILLGLAAFWFMGGNRFNWFNLALWVGGIIFVVRAFWVEEPHLRSTWRRFTTFIQQPPWHFSISSWSLLVIACAGLVLFFRLHQLNSVPPQMVSDQAEKLLDVWDVLHGQTPIFFVRNTGREAMQFYLTAAVIRLLDTGYTFLSLKIGTVLAGLLTLPFIYLLGKEVGSSRIGLMAMTMAGIAYWPNVIARVGLRFPLYALFVAPTLYFLLRGIRRSNRNDFILAGLFLGIGLHGYTPIRILPFVVAAAVGLYLIHRHSAGLRRQTIWSLIVLAFVAMMVFLPLLRYSLSSPDMFGYRAFSRLGSVERPLPGPAYQIFLQNTWRALTMYSWDNGQIWPVSVPGRPALDVVTGALFHLGVGLLLIRYLRRRHWLDLFLLLAVPMLMLPSILSLAYPAENPAPNRASGALVPVFLIAAVALDGLVGSLRRRLGQPSGTLAAAGLLVLLLITSASQNYDLVFRQYRRNYEQSSWNTTEMGDVIRRFALSAGRLESSWVVAFPHWADTRLVGMHAGDPTRDFAIQVDQIDETVYYPWAKLFLVNPLDQDAVNTLQEVYPQGWLQQYHSQYENRDFLIFVAPPDQGEFFFEP
jgi:hypothetical protein